MFVYVMLLDGGLSNRIKVGMAADPFLRLKQLQTAQAGRLNICHAAWLKGEMSARSLEGLMHDELRIWRCRGHGGGTEWFQATALQWMKRGTVRQQWRDMHPACAEFCDKRFKGTPLEVQSEIRNLL